MRIIWAIFTCLILWACANVGMPEGGPFDMKPPRLVSASPPERSTRVNTQRFTLSFDEFIRIKEQDKIIISPPQLQQAIISASGKSISIKLLDSLKANTTYSFYFDDAVVDNNEDNPLERFSYTFSTGDVLDTMQLGGIVLDAETLEPVTDLVVGTYWSRETNDSTVLRQSFPFASKTDKGGRFTIRGLRDSTYRIYALKDDDNNYKYDGIAEGFAFDTIEYRTTKLDSVKTDTIKIDSIVRRDTLYRDSIVSYNHTYYHPSNLILRYFKPLNKSRGLERSSREDSLKISLLFLEKQLVAPPLESLDKPNVASNQIYTTVLQGRQITYWLKDQELISRDSIRFRLSYPQTDSLFRVVTKVDTLTFFKPKAREETKKSDKEDKARNPFTLKFSGASGTKAETLHDSLVLTSNLPIEHIDPKHIQLEYSPDSVYKPLTFELRQDTLDALRYFIDFKRSYRHKYRVKIDSASLSSIYGHVNDAISFDQKVQEEKEFGALELTIKGITERVVIELLDKSGNSLLMQEASSTQTPSKEATQEASTDSLEHKPYTVLFTDLKPDDYYIRLFIDENKDGSWTTGEYPTRQPEMMYYSPQKYGIKKGFTTREEWSPLTLALEAQKPLELRKNKPQEQKKREDKNKEYYKRLGEKKRK